jgi:hypothetical protein
VSLSIPPTQMAYFPLTGGLDQITPPLSMADGKLRDALNFEAAFGGGYTRVTGYERYDGQAAPSDAVFYKLSCTFSDTVSAGDTITGQTSTATGVVVAVDSGAIYFTKLTGTFQSGENLQVGGVTKAVSTDGAAAASAGTQELIAQYKNLAADVYRADIAAVPGSGSVLGVWYYNSKVYAFRNNAGGTAAVMHEASAAGWVAVDLGYEVAFSNANTSVKDGDTLTQGGVTATIARVVVETGTLLSGTNTGRLIISAPAGGNFTAGAATSTGGGSLALGGAESAITLPIGGHYEFVNYNFGGGADTERMYGVNGVSRGFEFDGTVFVPIETGMTDDTPSHVAVHANHLFFSYGASAQHSSIGDPYQWSPVTGAGELAMGNPITAFQVLPGSEGSAAMAIFCEDRISILYGTSSADWNLVPFSREVGAKEWTVQNAGLTYFLDVFGIRQLQTSDAFGNFQQAQLSQLISPFMEARIGLASASYVVRKKNQYRLLFSDKYGVTLTFNGNRLVGLMPFLLIHSMSCACSSETSGGQEIILCGGTDGFVYRMEKGTSFDGDAIDASMVMTFNHFRSPRVRKRFRKAVYELTGNGFSKYEASYEIGYAAEEYDQTPITSSFTSSFSGTDWDAFSWDQFYWDGRTLLPSEQDLTGVAENLSLIVRSSYDYVDSFTVASVIVHYTPRRPMR